MPRANTSIIKNYYDFDTAAETANCKVCASLERNRLQGETAEKLLFVKLNLIAFVYKY